MARKPLTEEQREANRQAVRRYKIRNKDKITADRKEKQELINAKNREYYAKNKQKILEKHKKHYAANKDKKLAVQRSNRQANSDQISERQKRYRAENLEKVRRAERESKLKNRSKHMQKFAAVAAKRRAQTVCVQWADDFMILEMYDLARRRTDSTGIVWEVDHIVPLQSRLVCGLHVEHNLRVVPRKVNREKGNLMWPNHPNSSKAIFLPETFY